MGDMSDREHLPLTKPESTPCQEQSPEYARRFKDFAYSLDDLIRHHGEDAFSEKVKQFVADRKSAPCRPDLPLLRMFEPNESPTAKTLPEEYAILSAIHDVLCPEAEPIDPFQKVSVDDVKTREEYVAARKAEMAGAAYWALMADVKAVYRDMAERAENGPPSARELADDLFRELERIRKSVEADLKESLLGPRYDEVTHSDDFTSVIWGGRRYRFAKGAQAGVVRVLWKAYEDGGHSLTQETIGERVGSGADRFELAKVFRRRKTGGGYDHHPAWGTMIQQDSKGAYRLVLPESA